MLLPKSLDPGPLRLVWYVLQSPNNNPTLLSRRALDTQDELVGQKDQERVTVLSVGLNSTHMVQISQSAGSSSGSEIT